MMVDFGKRVNFDVSLDEIENVVIDENLQEFMDEI